jgi:PTH1 family peptidyl-tRNA hydrolase
LKFLIVGLGNFGIEYVGTRHNIGFDVVEHLAQVNEVSFASSRLADTAEFKHRGRVFHLIKPTTFMNLSGRSMQYWMDKLKVPIERTLVIVDDLQLPLGRLRLREKGSSGGHNGLSHIEETLGNNHYARLRFGIGSDFNQGQQVDFVLGKWSKDELLILKDRIPKAADGVLAFGTQSFGRAMDIVNKIK